MQTDTILQAVKARLNEKMNERERGPMEPHLVAYLVGEVFRELERSGTDTSGVDRRLVGNRAVFELMRVGPLLEPLVDPDITEIMVNGPETIFLEKNGKRFRFGQTFADDRELRAMVARMVELVPGKRIDEAAPMVDLSLPDGSRMNIAIPPVVVGGPQITIRKYMRSLNTLEDLIAKGSLDMRMAAFLRAAVKAQANIVFSGASGSGKTTLMEILGREIPENERLVVIEDTLELHFDQPNVVRMLTRAPNIEGFGEITTSELFRNSLRMRPNRIILGEIRGPEALDYLQALNSGHRGSLGVIHASSPAEAAIRIENLSMSGEHNVPVSVVRQQLVHGVDLIVQMEQLADGTRKVTGVAQLSALAPDGGFDVEDVFRFQPSGVDAQGHVQGEYVATGIVPYFVERIHLAGLKLPESLFAAG